MARTDVVVLIAIWCRAKATVLRPLDETAVWPQDTIGPRICCVPTRIAPKKGPTDTCWGVESGLEGRRLQPAALYGDRAGTVPLPSSIYGSKLHLRTDISALPRALLRVGFVLPSRKADTAAGSAEKDCLPAKDSARYQPGARGTASAKNCTHAVAQHTPTIEELSRRD